MYSARTLGIILICDKVLLKDQLTGMCKLSPLQAERTLKLNTTMPIKAVRFVMVACSKLAGLFSAKASTNITNIPEVGQM